MNPRLLTLHERIEPLRRQLASHPLYASIRSFTDLKTFMESHVFAVWDFMSLLKTLQRSLTCVEVPWQPTADAATRRFINEIVLGEESDSYDGEIFSHFELYLRAMHESGADTQPMETFTAALGEGVPVERALTTAPAAAAAFVRSTFSIIDSGSLPAIASAFTFGREDLIPEMFRGFVRELNTAFPGKLKTFLFYLERHIEMDGDDHGPLSLQMVENICGNDALRWEKAAQAAETALRARIALWDGILLQQGVLSAAR